MMLALLLRTLPLLFAVVHVGATSASGTPNERIFMIVLDGRGINLI